MPVYSVLALRALSLVRYFIDYFSTSTIFSCLQRPESVKIDAQDVNGARFTVNLSGLPARVFQHEFDHLEVFINVSLKIVFNFIGTYLTVDEASLVIPLSRVKRN